MANSTLTTMTAVLSMNNSKFKKGLTGSQKALKGFQKQVLNIGGAVAAAFSVRAIADFTKEAVQLSAQMEGVEAAFMNLGRPGLLNELRSATRNTVTDLQLMQKAVQAKNFKIPLEQLATYFEFATNRAIQTGESVDYLVDSIITGIGRKSVLVMDNLGISAAELQEEVKKVGDFGLAAGNIIERSLREAGDVASTTATQIAQMTTAWQNFKTSVGDSEVVMFFLRGVKAGLEDITKLLNRGGGAAGAAFVDFYDTLKDKEPAEKMQALKDKVVELNEAVKDGAEKRMALNKSLSEYDGRFRRQKRIDTEQQIELIDEEQNQQIALRKIIETQIKALEKEAEATSDVAGESDKVFEAWVKINDAKREAMKLDQTIADNLRESLDGILNSNKGGDKADLWGFLSGDNEEWGGGREGWEDIADRMSGVQSQAKELGNMVGMSLVNQFGALGNAIGQFATGAEGAFNSLGDAIMQNLGNILIMMGAQMGPAGLPLLLAGIGLQLGGGIIRGLGNKTSSAATSGGGAGGDVEFRIMGKDLVGTLNRYNNYNQLQT